MDYSGVIGTQAVVYSRSTMMWERYEKRALYTQFENSDARRFMPSWDEPILKQPTI